MNDFLGKLDIKTEEVEIKPTQKQFSFVVNELIGVEIYSYTDGLVVPHQLGEPLTRLQEGESVVCQSFFGRWWTGIIVKEKDGFSIDFDHSVGFVGWCDTRKCHTCVHTFNKKVLGRLKLD